MRDKLLLDAVVTVVDAKHIWQHWDAEEAQEQVTFADVVLLNKTDLVGDEELAELEKQILCNKCNGQNLPYPQR